MVVVTAEPINPAKAYGMINTESTGSVLLHYAVVKPLAGEGGTTSYIDFTANNDTKAELQEIADRLCTEHTVSDILLMRRTGRLGLGDIISLVAVSSPNSEDAFEACKKGLGCIRKIKNIIKVEVCD
ncbi:MAG: molybdenum cofactor biosynthesis protein MoaE [Desulfuromonadaceae bacterium]|nr:molybdenum cofactor biosynthesis protein MoaE [Desulfuromonadaceae bacterium]MDD5107626.1 molybdenum cofactor biosynthesis protein MoaE [Desulfuromonadaceae bacterium]